MPVGTRYKIRYSAHELGPGERRRQDGKALVLEGEGLFARMLQHETDHLHGKLFIDRLIGEDRKRVMRAIRAADYNKVTAQTSAERAMRVGGSFGASLGSFRA